MAAKTWILYGRVRMPMVQDDTACFRPVRVQHCAVRPVAQLQHRGGHANLGRTFLTGYTGTTAKNKLCATGVDTSEWVDFALLYCSKFGGPEPVHPPDRWHGSLANRNVVQQRFRHHLAAGLSGGSTAVGDMPEFDRLMALAPTSWPWATVPCKGSHRVLPDPAIGWNNDESSWQRHFAGYPDLMNNLMVNVGVGGDDTTDLLARLQNDVLVNKPKRVFVHGTMNAGSETNRWNWRTANHQAIIDAVVNKGCHHVLLNANYGTEAFNVPTPAPATITKGWWTITPPDVEGQRLLVDIMQPQLDANGYTDTALVASDGAHPSIACYQTHRRIHRSAIARPPRYHPRKANAALRSYLNETAQAMRMGSRLTTLRERWAKASPRRSPRSRAGATGRIPSHWTIG